MNKRDKIVLTGLAIYFAAVLAWAFAAEAQEDPLPWASDSDIIHSFNVRFYDDPLTIAVVFAPMLQQYGFTLLRDAPLVLVEYHWDEATDGTEAESYVVMASTNGGEYQWAMETRNPWALLTVAADDTIAVMVAGIDIDLAQGPYSLPSVPYCPADDGWQQAVNAGVVSREVEWE